MTGFKSLRPHHTLPLPWLYANDCGSRHWRDRLRIRSTLMRMAPSNVCLLTGQRTLIWRLAWCLTVLMAPAAAAQNQRLEIEYTVKVADIPGGTGRARILFPGD